MLDFAFFRDLAIAFAMFVGAGIGLPFPEEVLIVGAGVWTAARANYGLFRWLMLPVCVLGVLIADCLLYGIGRWFGPQLLRTRFGERMVPPEKRQRIEENYHNYGVWILVFGRLLPGIRVPLFLTAGILRLPVARFVVADSIGAILGNSILYFLAFWFGDRVLQIVINLKQNIFELGPYLVLLLIAGVGVYLVIHFYRKPVTEGDPKELPLIGGQIAAHIDYSGDHKINPVPPAKPSNNGEVDPQTGVAKHKESEEKESKG